MVQILLWYYTANDPGTASASRPEMPPEWAGVNNFGMVYGTGGFCGRRNGVKGRMECHGVWTMGSCEHELILDGGFRGQITKNSSITWKHVGVSGLQALLRKWKGGGGGGVAEGEAKRDPRWSQKLESNCHVHFVVFLSPSCRTRAPRLPPLDRKTQKIKINNSCFAGYILVNCSIILQRT